jgi:nitrite reductase/ring-hydroxylating ferredoxin subunit
MQPGELREFRIGGISIVLACKDQVTFFALRNICPHQGADLSKGWLTGTNMPSDVGQFRFDRRNEILRCPWHAWEYDLCTGRSLHDPRNQRVKSYVVSIEDDHVVVEYPQSGRAVAPALEESMNQEVKPL